MSRILRLIAENDNEGQRLDVFVAAAAGVSRSAAQGLEVLSVDGRAVPKNHRVKQGDVYTVSIPDPSPIEAVPQDIDVEIVYEDDDLLVVNKPQGMVVHPAAGNPDGTLVNALLYKCSCRLSSINGKVRPGIVHRLDKDTAGLLIVAKNDTAHVRLAEQIQEHSFVRKYRAVVTGVIKNDCGTVDVPLGRSITDRKKRAAAPNAVGIKPAVTHYRVLRRYREHTYLELTLETGRTHQIRVHMKHIGHPVLGDPLYGGHADALGLKGQCLCAFYIAFRHPADGREMRFEVPLPEFFEKTLNKLERIGSYE